MTDYSPQREAYYQEMQKQADKRKRLASKNRITCRGNRMLSVTFKNNESIKEYTVSEAA